MPFGIRVINGAFKGVSARIKGKSLSVEQSFEGSLDGFRHKAATMGLPLKDFFVKSITLPELPKKELDEAVKLQISSSLPFNESDAYVGHRLKKLQKGYGLLIVATLKRAFYKPKAILPEPLAVYALAMVQGMITPDKKSLIIHIKGEEVFTLAVEGHDIVFVRSFLKDENFKSELKLCAQSVYLKEERSLLEVGRVVLFGGYGDCIEEIKDAFSGQATPPEIISNGMKIEDELLIPAGLACSSSVLGKFKGWNVYQGDVDYMASIIKGLKFTLPLWPLFLVAYFYADNFSKKSSLEGVKGRIKGLNPKHEEVLRLEGEVAVMGKFFEESGRDMTTPGSWLEILSALEKSRPYGLWFTIISGKSFGTVLVSGKAEAYPLVTEFMEALNFTGKVSDLNLVFTHGSGEGVDFQISLKMVGGDDEI